MRDRCSTKDCPWPFDPDIHHCWARCEPWHECDGTASHQHHPRKGMGGNNPNSKIVAILCLALHDAIDNGLRYQGRRWSNDVKGGIFRLIDRTTGVILLEVPVVA